MGLQFGMFEGKYHWRSTGASRNRCQLTAKIGRSEEAAEMTEFLYSRTVAGPQLEALHESRIWRATGIVQKAREDLDADLLAQHLAENAVYESQSVLEPFVGKDGILAYLRERFVFLRELRTTSDTGSLVSGRVDLPQAADHPCLIFVVEEKRQALWVVSVDATGKISRIDVLTVAPTPDEARPTS